VADAYSTHHPCALEYKTIRTPTERRCIWVRDSLREEAELPYPAEKCIYARTELRSLSLQDHVLKMTLATHMLFASEAGILFSVCRNFQIEHETDMNDDCSVLLWEPVFMTPDITVHGDKADIRIPWEVRGDVWMEGLIQSVASISVEEDKPLNDRPASIVMARKGNRSLWEMAKRYGSRMGEIETTNRDCADCDKLLLIPHVR